MDRMVIRFAHGFRNLGRQLIYRVRPIGSYIKYFVPGSRNQRRTGNARSYITDITKRPLLSPVAEYRHRIVFTNLLHENTNDIAIRIGQVLIFSVNIMRPEDHVVETEHLVSYSQIHLNG